METTPLLEFRKDFKKFFPELNPNEYLDRSFWLVNRSVKIDVIKLDDWLHGKFGKYETSKKIGMSMSQALEKYISKAASEFVRSYL